MTQFVAPSAFADSLSARNYILACERQFASSAMQIADCLAADDDLRLIGLSGPSCAGKTTAAGILIDCLQQRGKRVHLISIDDFFREQSNAKAKIDPDGKIDFDSIDALDFPLFKACLTELMQKGKTMIPRYDLGKGQRTGFCELCAPEERDVFLIEGIQVVYPEISALLHQYAYRCLYINVQRELLVGDRRFLPDEIRLLRRLVRDYYFRSSNAEFTLFLWDSVRENEQKNIFPNANGCEEHLDSLMGYEIGMLRPHLEHILAPVMQHTRYGTWARELRERISTVTSLDSDLLPPNALYREFVPVQKQPRKN